MTLDQFHPTSTLLTTNQQPTNGDKMSLPNIWYLRRVADTATRACYICYKPSSSVLITPDNKVCMSMAWTPPKRDHK